MVKNRWAAWLVFACVTGCAPLTFSKDESIDFSAYPVVRVEVWVGSHEDLNAAEYLAEELRESSGFAEVVSGPRQTSDAVLLVDVSVTQTDDDEWDSSASYQLLDAQQRVIDSGDSEDTSGSVSEAVEDALDEVALKYYRPYRI